MSDNGRRRFLTFGDKNDRESQAGLNVIWFIIDHSSTASSAISAPEISTWIHELLISTSQRHNFCFSYILIWLPLQKIRILLFKHKDHSNNIDLINMCGWNSSQNDIKLIKNLLKQDKMMNHHEIIDWRIFVVIS